MNQYAEDYNWQHNIYGLQKLQEKSWECFVDIDKSTVMQHPFELDTILALIGIRINKFNKHRYIFETCMHLLQNFKV